MKIAVKTLYFGIDISKAPCAILDNFLALKSLHHDEKVAVQRSLTISIALQTDQQAWSEQHTFTFTDSPLAGFKIKSGFIQLRIGKTATIAKILDLHWVVEFESEVQGKNFFAKLKEIFSQVSTMQQEEDDEDVGRVAQYSTRNMSESGIKDITFCFGKSLNAKNYQVALLLGNEFMKA